MAISRRNLMLALLGVSLLTLPAADAPVSYAPWENGPPAETNFFPIAVWVQSPQNAARYRAAGINVFVGLWRGPTEQQLAQLAAADMRVICSQNAYGLQQKTNRTIIGWMHGDEPDNAQSLGQGKGYGPPILPQTIFTNYLRIKAADPTRPVLLNLGQGVAWDNYIGRGVRRNHPEDYPEYVKGCDIASFDIYPVVHDSPEIAGKLETVPFGVQRLIEWTGGTKPVWNCIECTRISNVRTKPTPAEVRAEVWMSLIHGSRGLIYFVHQFAPTFREAALLDDPEMLAGVTAINQQIHDLAPMLNGPTLTDAVRSESSNPNAVIANLVKRDRDSLYVFTVNMRNQPTRAMFRLAGTPAGAEVEVLGESRKLALASHGFVDEFSGYGVHLYRVGPRR
jgi:hypothetical protein